MATSATEAPVRITVAGPRGSFDAGVWSGTTPAELLEHRRVRSALGLYDRERAVVVSPSGQRFDERRPLLDQRVDDGDVLTVLVAERPGPGSGHRARGRSRRTTRPQVVVTRPVGPVLAALALLTTAGAVTVPESGPARAATAYVLLVVAVAGAVAAPKDAWGDRCRMLSPLAAAAGVLTLLAGSGPGRMHAALTAAAVSAAVTAATARAGALRRASPGRVGPTPVTPPVADHLLVVVALAAAGAVVLGGGLLLGMPLRACGVVIAAAAALAPRLLPSAVVDVPDEALLELDRLSVTAWSAHERLPQRGWRRLRAYDVADLVGRARRLFSTTTVLCTALAVVGTAAAVAGDRIGLARYGSATLAVCVALTLALSARTVRDETGRGSLLVGGAAIGLAAAVAVLASLGTGWRAVVFVAAVLAAGGVVPAALALGRGWRSVRWARTGDVVEGLAVALVAPAAFVAAGGFDWVRQLVN